MSDITIIRHELLHDGTSILQVGLDATLEEEYALSIIGGAEIIRVSEELVTITMIWPPQMNEDERTLEEYVAAQRPMLRDLIAHALATLKPPPPSIPLASPGDSL